jgi:hypothetical protein
MTPHASLFAKPVPPNPASSTPRQRARYVHEQTRLYARDLALQHLVHPDPEAEGEHFCAVAGIALGCGCCHSEVLHIAATEWRFAIAYAGNFLEALRRTLYPMCRAHIPERAIQQRADAIMAEWGVYLPDQLLNPVLAGIWHAAQPRRRRPRVPHDRVPVPTS